MLVIDVGCWYRCGGPAIKYVVVWAWFAARCVVAHVLGDLGIIAAQAWVPDVRPRALWSVGVGDRWCLPPRGRSTRSTTSEAPFKNDLRRREVGVRVI